MNREAPVKADRLLDPARKLTQRHIRSASTPNDEVRVLYAGPTQLRATATGWGIGVGRLGSIVGSALGGVLLTGLGPSGYFAALAVPLVVAAAATLLVKAARAQTTEGELEAVAAGH
ncbi:hypothetical protein [Sinomonas sp. P10A9]|uniref:MFS transporter n=1 Tax=Sinomonas puerhi TaxID=3238584 RepID=A0AB39L603_9MICC